MGAVFKHTEQYLGNAQDTVFLEIGSDRYEGSTEYFADLAQKHGAEMHSIDIVDDAQKRLRHLPVRWHLQWGSDWCKDELPKLQKQVSCVYLDNFDYIWDIEQPESKRSLEQKQWYQDVLDIPMQNQTCQVEHMKQMIEIFPYLTNDAVVAFDDTHTLNDCWVGKCGPIVVWLLAQGFELVRNERFEYGVILKRQTQ